ncbi:MAG: peptidylprolyl isomerase [Clostridia bacterium]|nr:peptidylprolyl isomerase [Clostridia bacterium]
MENINVKITVQNYGEIELELYPDKAPITVENFVRLVKSNFYENLIFHRVIEGFMIQGGGYDYLMNDTNAATIKGEFASNGFTQNDIKHTRGVISMARTMIPNSASSQFFIMHKDAPHLDGQYAAFGKVTKGIEVVDKIASVPTNFSDCPVTPVMIEKIEII